MILYDPLHGDAWTRPIRWMPRTCFLMTKLGSNVPGEVTGARERLAMVLADHQMHLVDAESSVTGRDILLKIWQYMIAVPVGIAIVYRGIPRRTLGNVFFELGLMAALGKETVVVRMGNAAMPSDFVRTEWINYDDRFEEKLAGYLRSLSLRAEYFGVMAEQLERDALLAIDCYRRAFLLTGEPGYKTKAKRIYRAARLDERARDSIEVLMASFCV